MDITFDLQTPDGKSAEVLSKVIEARKNELGETTSQSCVAIALNILRGVRAQTKVAKESQMDISLVLSDDKYYPSFKRGAGAKGKNVSARVLRMGKDGPTVQPKRVVWAIGKYHKGEEAHSYEVEDKISPDKSIKYIIVAKDEKSAMRYAKAFHRRRVKQHKSLARHAIGVAMKAVYDKGSSNDNVNEKVRSLARQNVEATVNETGFDKGDVRIWVHDKLNYAALALENGYSSVNTAIANALRKTMGMIEQRMKSNGGQIDKSLKMSIDDLAGRAGA